MARPHLTDSEIQELLDGNISQQAALSNRHLEQCKMCRDSLKNYQILTSALGKDPGFQLPKNFGHSVVSRLPEKQSTISFSPLFEKILIPASLILALMTTIYFVDLKTIARALAPLSFFKIDFQTALFVPIKNLLSSFNGSFHFLPFAMAALLTVATIDRLIQKRKHRTHIPWQSQM